MHLVENAESPALLTSAQGGGAAVHPRPVLRGGDAAHPDGPAAVHPEGPGSPERPPGVAHPDGPAGVHPEGHGPPERPPGVAFVSGVSSALVVDRDCPGPASGVPGTETATDELGGGLTHPLPADPPLPEPAAEDPRPEDADGSHGALTRPLGEGDGTGCTIGLTDVEAAIAPVVPGSCDGDPAPVLPPVGAVSLLPYPPGAQPRCDRDEVLAELPDGSSGSGQLVQGTVASGELAMASEPNHVNK